jgi:hypothetical protein
VGRTYYEGKGLLRKGSDRLVGRCTEYSELQGVVSRMIKETTNSTAVAISGIGGIGYSQTPRNSVATLSDYSLARPSYYLPLPSDSEISPIYSS